MAVAVRERALYSTSSNSYGCVHWRQGDFHDHCQLLLALEQSSYLSKWEKGSSCFQTPFVLRDNLQKNGMLSSLTYVSTDNVTGLGAPGMYLCL